jgi:hypothetical protein
MSTPKPSTIRSSRKRDRFHPVLAGAHVLRSWVCRYRGDVCDILALESPFPPLPKAESTEDKVSIKAGVTSDLPLTHAPTLQPAAESAGAVPPPSGAGRHHDPKPGQRPTLTSCTTTPTGDVVAPPPVKEAPSNPALPKYKVLRAGYTVSRPLEDLAAELLAAIPDPEDLAAAAEVAEGEAAPPTEPLVFTPSNPPKPVKGKPVPPPKYWRPPFLPLPDEDVAKLTTETPHLVEAYFQQRDAAFLVLPDEELATLDEKSRAEYDAVNGAIQERAEAKARALAEVQARIDAERAERLRTPRDKDNQRWASPSWLLCVLCVS